MHISTLVPGTILLPLLLATLATAHVKLVSPTPYGASTLNTNPLLTTGADYPCKLRPSAFDITTWNLIPHSTPQTLSFQGQATHGGGSCQISLSRDTPPNAESVFKVIKTIEGGCPSANAGNVGTDPFGYGADTFEYEIPDVVGTGNFTLAWTWFNKIGEREMYMNCAPVTVTAKAGGRRGRRRSGMESRGDGFDALPDMFRANSGTGCTTAESGTVLAIPEENLGSVVQRIGSEALVPPVGECEVKTGPVEGGVGADAKVAGSSPAAPPVEASPSILSQVVQVSEAPVVEPAVSALPAPTSPLAPPAPAPSAPATASAPSTPSIPGVSTGTCPTPGKSICSPDGKAWGTCMPNLQVIFQPVAAGTRCDVELGTEVPV